LCRTTINQRIGCIKRILKWAVSEQLVPPGVYHGLQAVDGLRRGRSAAKEAEPVRPVPDVHVDAVLPFLPPTVAAMVRLHRLTGMRSGELCLLRTCDVDTSSAVWLYRPATHKTAYRGHQRVVQIGPQGQAVLRSYLRPEVPEAYVFSPRQAQAERNLTKRLARKTKVQPSQASRKKQRPTKQPGERYDTKSYFHAIRYAIGRAIEAGVLAKEQYWHPHQLSQPVHRLEPMVNAWRDCPIRPHAPNVAIRKRTAGSDAVVAMTLRDAGIRRVLSPFRR
jgi:integrase